MLSTIKASHKIGRKTVGINSSWKNRLFWNLRGGTAGLGATGEANNVRKFAMNMQISYQVAIMTGHVRLFSSSPWGIYVEEIFDQQTAIFRLPHKKVMIYRGN